MTHPDRAIEAGAQQLVTLEFGRHARLENLTVPMQARYRDDIKSILTALAAEGLVVVPAEPTWSMMIAGRDAILTEDEGLDLSTDDARAAYTAMLAAAQEQNDASK